MDTLRAQQTPLLLIDRAAITRNYRIVAGAFGEDGVYFAVKANDHPDVLAHLAALGSSFDVASFGELELLLAIGVGGDRVVFSNPVKVPADIGRAHAAGVRMYVVDTVDEVRKVAAHAPGSSVLVRIAVDNTGSGWPLHRKFGVDEPGESAALFVAARDEGLIPAGVTFHVGSQCAHIANWEAAIDRCAEAWKAADAQGITLGVIDIGGGIPAPYAGRVPSVPDIAHAVQRRIAALFPPGVRTMVEPGRFLVAEAGTIVASVIGRAERKDETRVFLDIGVFSGLMEAYEAFWYPVEVLDGGGRPREKVTLFGPSCDSVDVIVKDIELPRLTLGDRIIFRFAGAYTNSYERYNGFRFPEVILR